MVPRAPPPPKLSAMESPKLNRRTNAALAGLTGLLLLVGSGATFATWSAAAASAEEVTLGHLSIEAEQLSWFDVSDLEGVRNAEFVPADDSLIDIEQFRLVPGDVLLATGLVTSTLVGDNLVAELSLSGHSEIPHWVLVDLEFVNADGEVVQAFDRETGESVYLNKEAAQDESGEWLDATVSVRLLIEFPITTTEYMRERSESLSDLSVELQQVLSTESD